MDVVILKQKPSRRNRNGNIALQGRGSFVARLVTSAIDRKPKALPLTRFCTIGGVYFDEHSSDEKPVVHRAEEVTKSDAQSFADDQTSTTTLGSCENSCSSKDKYREVSHRRKWISSGSSKHNDGTPLLAKSLSRSRINPQNLPLTEAQLLDYILLKSRMLPKNTYRYLTSNHVMINNERTKKSIAPLLRMRSLDELAEAHATAMAKQNRLFHSDREVLFQQIAPDGRRRIGENVTRGQELAIMHEFMMRILSDRNNILDRRFAWMGIGTAKSSSGNLFLCQIFRD